jgi:hypothetical protein
VQRLRTKWNDLVAECEAADAIEEQANRIEELEHQLKFECDAYLWKRKLMSRRIAFLQGWMTELFKYVSSQDAKRNQMTMTTEIPDYLIRAGEDILSQTSASDVILESEDKK